MAGRTSGSSLIYSEFRRNGFVMYNRNEMTFHCMLCGEDVKTHIRKHLSLKHRAEYQTIKAGLNESV